MSPLYMVERAFSVIRDIFTRVATCTGRSLMAPRVHGSSGSC